MLLEEADIVDNRTIVAEVINGTSNVNITWKAPEEPNGGIRSYEVKVINLETKAVCTRTASINEIIDTTQRV